MSKLAVIETGGKHYLVRPNDIVDVEKIDGDTSQEISFDKVLLLSDEDGNDLQVGTPYIEGDNIKAVVEDQFKDKKVSVIKYKSKTRYRRKLSHRQHKTKVKISDF